MDIGLEKLIEMIEQRLGKLAGNILLGLVVLAVVGVSLHLIWQYILEPLGEGFGVIGAWLLPLLSGLPAPKPHLPTTFHEFVRLVLFAIGGAASGALLFMIGGVVRLVIEDHKIARDVRRNEPWTDERAMNVHEKAWLRRR